MKFRIRHLKDTGRAHRLFDRKRIRRSIQVAQDNWKEWRDVFEHGGAIATSPLLTDPRRFASFCKGYSVGRTIRRGTQNEFRLALIESLSAHIEDSSGRALDKLEGELRPRFGTNGGKNRLVSVLSKVAAFVRPEQFVAWDSYAKKGVNIVLGRRANFRSYADYLAAFNQAWDGQPGQQIRDFVRANRRKNTFEREARFLRRDLDVCFMQCGGRTL